MKTLTAFSRKVLILMMLLVSFGFVLNQNGLMGQVPDCSGTLMYGIWNDSISSTRSTPSEIRSINYVTGAVGPLVGGTTYLIKKSGTGGPYYGSAGLGLDPVNKIFYVMTQMSSAIPKDIISINPVTAKMDTVATTPTSSTGNIPDVLSNYHFVKLAISPGGIGYAIGVRRDTVSGGFDPAKCNPLISFTTCASPSLNCSTIKLLGYLSNSISITTNWNLFNGDIAFDNAGNMYFMTVAFANVASNGRYTDARLFKIAAANIPSAVGTGSIPLSLVADYNSLDSTVVNGIAFNLLGEMYFATRTFNGPQNNSPKPTFNNVIYKSLTPGNAALVAGFTNPTAGMAIADLASCNFPTGVLSDVKLQLNGWNESGTAKLKWDVNMNNQVSYYELQSSDDGNEFETISHISPQNINTASATYSYADANTNNAKVKYYRVREILPSGTRYYSNVVKVNFSSKLMLINKPSPNPFVSQFNLNLELKTSAAVSIKIITQSGSVLRQRMVNGAQGANRITVDGLTGLSAGIYVVEIRVDEEVIREKLIKR